MLHSNCITALDNAIQYSLPILLAVFMEEVRELIIMKQSQSKGKYNLTLNGHKRYFDYFPQTNS